MLKVNKDLPYSTIVAYVANKAPINGEFEMLIAGSPPTPVGSPQGKTLEQLALLNKRLIQKIL